MPKPMQHQFFVQHYFPRPFEGWGSVGDGMATMAEAVEAMLSNGDFRLDDPLLWIVERVDRYGKTYITDVTDEAYNEALATMAKRTVWPRQLPEWHPDYEAPEDYPAPEWRTHINTGIPAVAGGID
jgi:hypothetical protein